MSASGHPEAVAQLFGTDGIRGPAGEAPLDRDTMWRLGRHLAECLVSGDAPPSVVLGGDTRASTPEICGWLAAGLAAGGARYRFAGVLPTPAISCLVTRLEADCGIAVSASHNPFTDNGVKLLDRDGGKWASRRELELEQRLLGDSGRGEPAAATLEPESGLADLYREHLRAQLPAGRPLTGLRVALDTANGAASGLAASLFTELGAEVVAIHDRPDGRNINRGCGSTHPEELAATTVEAECGLGFAFDGDADRVILADETGTVRDGDALLYLWATALHAEGALRPPRVVATSMSNLGLERALAAAGIELVRCGVGDRAVADAMRAAGALLGGEQSGHIIRSDLAPTGDGLQSALHLAALVRRSARPVSALVAGFERYPQTLVNVPVATKPALESLPAVAAATDSVRRRLADRGRLVLRYSGTEPLARVMIEGESRPLIDELASELADAIRKEIGRD